MPVVCTTHGRIAVPAGPSSDCDVCWAAYGRWARAYVGALALDVKRGKAKGGGRSSKAKGRAASVEVALLLRSKFALPDTEVFVKATSQIGADLHLSELAEALFPYAIEVKNVELLNIWAALKQAQLNAGSKTPILFFKRAGTALFVALSAEHFVGLHANQSQKPQRVDDGAQQDRPETL